LQDAIAAYEGTVVLVSHDVAFVRAVAEGIIAVAPGGGGVRRFAGGYDYYREKIEREAAGTPDAGPEVEKSVDAAKAARAEALRDRKTLKNDLRREERKVEALEKEIAELETEQYILHDQLAAANTPEDVRAAAGRRLREVEDALSVREVAWEIAGKRRDELAEQVGR
jgi:ATPase subunit of ABC transporter with duplicated ATPase domains